MTAIANTTARRPDGLASPRWCWCDTCEAWVGPTPPFLVSFWPVETSAAMHRRGTGHAVRFVTFDELTTS